MNYYYEWWEQARQSTGIWTKKTYQDYLEQRIKDLEAGQTGQAYLALETEKSNWKSKYEKAKKEIQSLDNLLDSLTEENQAKEAAKIQAETKLGEVNQEYQELGELAQTKIKELKSDYEKELAEATKDKMACFKDNLFKETRIKELQSQGQSELVKLEAAKAEAVKKYEKQQEELTNFLQENKATSLTELSSKLKNLEQESKKIAPLEEKVKETREQLTLLNSQKVLAKPSFEEIELLVAKNKILLFPIKKKLKTRTEEIKTAFQWGSLREDWELVEDTGSTTSTLTPTASKEKDLEKKITELLEDKKDKDQRILALELDKQELLRKLTLATPEPATPLTPSVPSWADTPLFESVPEPTPKLTKKEQQWRGISFDFTKELIKDWESQGFTYDQTKAWINTGLTVQDSPFATWLKKSKNLEPLQFLNADSDALKAEYEQEKEFKK
jgi:hypothetical protein